MTVSTRLKPPVSCIFIHRGHYSSPSNQTGDDDPTTDGPIGNSILPPSKSL